MIETHKLVRVVVGLFYQNQGQILLVQGQIQMSVCRRALEVVATGTRISMKMMEAFVLKKTLKERPLTRREEFDAVYVTSDGLIHQRPIARTVVSTCPSSRRQHSNVDVSATLSILPCSQLSSESYLFLSKLIEWA